MNSQHIPEEPRYHLTQYQILQLVRPIALDHIEKKQGRSYIAQWQARAELTRIFGFGNWDSRVVEMQLVYERPVNKGEPGFPDKAKFPNQPYWVTCYRAAVEVNIRDYWGRPVCSFIEYHVEENSPQPERGEAHALAMTSVESYAFRRAVIGLGDRLGLGLYNGGKADAVVQVGGVAQLDDPESPQRYIPQAPQAPQGATQQAIAADQAAQIAVPPAVQQMREQGAQDPHMARVAQGLKVDARDGADA
jgi:hypothetical protein